VSARGGTDRPGDWATAEVLKLIDG